MGIRETHLEALGKVNQHVRLLQHPTLQIQAARNDIFALAALVEFDIHRERERARRVRDEVGAELHAASERFDRFVSYTCSATRLVQRSHQWLWTIRTLMFDILRIHAPIPAPQTRYTGGIVPDKRSRQVGAPATAFCKAHFRDEDVVVDNVAAGAASVGLSSCPCDQCRQISIGLTRHNRQCSRW